MPDIHKIPPRELYEFLESENIKELFHANTLHTSCVYLKEGNLISRQAVEEGIYSQTPQKSDKIDKVYGIWNDIFLDSVDICDRAGLPNEYGPILFQVSNEILLAPEITSCKITRFNPTKWSNYEPEDYYLKYDNYKEKFSCGNFDHMITLQTVDGKVSLPDILKKIIIDSPQLSEFTDQKIDVYSYCRGAIRFAIFQKEDYNPTYEKRPNPLNEYYNQLSEEERLKRFNARYDG